ncbi:efflux RND transporter permease subunit [Gluconobacter morbifer]|uniref:Heavy-metal ion transporter HelA n=1 Tax=Gluconobacter morbifer G707 TaxID=1088869 RepID=G6XFC6_9PROT|nr:CusA/CzcA family heavy metal efflux RND transporter [Gluconobacter morbifer]EHH68884.1 heavy-metal ion transporter HelA [Gluconobacter morbifer G707]
MFELFQTNRLVVLGLLAAVLAGCLMTVPGLPVEPVPDISPRQVLVSVTAPGLATEQVERLITFPMEAGLTGIPGTRDLRSVSRSGVSVVYLEFDDGTDIDLDRARVSERLQSVRENMTIPGVSVAMGPLATGMGEIMQLQIGGAGSSLTDLNRMMTWTVAPQLRLVPGVVDVNVNGGAAETFQVALDPARLLALGVTVGDVCRAVDDNNATAGGGWIVHHAEQEVVVGRALVGSLDDFAAIPVKLGQDGQAIRLRDVGTVRLGARTRLGAVTRDGKGEAVVGVVMMQQGASSNAVLAAIRQALPAIRQSLPPGVTLEPFYSRATLTGQTIRTVKENLLLGAVLVLGVLFVVLGDWRAAAVIASVIPAALLMAMAGMRFFGVSANLLSLGAIDFGMIVDSSLVVIEYLMVERERQQDRSLSLLVADAARAVARPVSFAIFVIIMVYLPILTLQGVEGKMFRPMAETVIMALLASLAYCFVCVPVLAALIMGHSRPHRETGFVRLLRRYYEPGLRWTEEHGGKLILFTACAFLLGVFLASRLGGEFVPQLEEGSLVLTSTRLPSASLATVLQGVTEQEKILRSFPEVSTVVSNTGTAAIPTDPMGTNETDTFVFLKPRSEWKTASSQTALVEAMDDALHHRLPSAAYSWSQPIQMRMDDLLSGVRTQLAVSIYGEDLSVLSRLADQVAAAIRGVPGAADVASQVSGQVPFLNVDINRDAAARLGVTVQDILTAVEVIGGHIGHPVTVSNAIIPTEITMRPDAVSSPEKIGRLQIRRSDGLGWVLLSEVAHVALVDGPPSITRDNIRRRLVVQANVRGRDVSSFVAAAQKAVEQQVKMPPGYRVVWSGQFRNMQSALRRLAIVVPLSLGLIFLLLLAALGSMQAAALVFVNLPVAATGGIIALTLRGLPFSIAAGIGFIALFGVAILNGVVLASQIRIFRREGMRAAEAAFQGARARFRPVIATASVASLGFFPMAFSNGSGAEVERPLATVVIGGLVSSTLLTLFVLPTLYARFFGRQD